MGNVLDLAEVDVVQGVERVPVSRAALAAGWATSLVKTGKGNSHKAGPIALIVTTPGTSTRSAAIVISGGVVFPATSGPVRVVSGGSWPMS